MYPLVCSLWWSHMLLEFQPEIQLNHDFLVVLMLMLMVMLMLVFEFFRFLSMQH